MGPAVRGRASPQKRRVAGHTDIRVGASAGLPGAAQTCARTLPTELEDR